MPNFTASSQYNIYFEVRQRSRERVYEYRLHPGMYLEEKKLDILLLLLFFSSSNYIYMFIFIHSPQRRSKRVSQHKPSSAPDRRHKIRIFYKSEIRVSHDFQCQFETTKVGQQQQ